MSGDSQAWLQYLSSMYGISQQQAAMMLQNPDAMAAMQNPTNPHGDGPDGPVNADPRLGSSVTMNSSPPPAPIMAAQTTAPPAPSAGPPVGAGMLDQSGVQRGPMGVLRTQPGASAPVGAGLPDQSGVARSSAGVLQPGLNPNAPAANASPAGPAPIAGPLASGGAGGVGSTSNPRFVGVDRPNADPQNSMRAGPQGTALNLAGLFGGGQGGAVNPNAPAAAAQPVSGPLAKGGIANAPMPPVMPLDIRNKRVANAIKDPNWWQNL
jgi:hypothetical protein